MVKRWSSLLLLFMLTIVAVNAQEGVTITTSDGEFARCFPDTLIEVKIDVPAGHVPIDSFRMRWCATCPPISIPGSDNPPVQSHRYSLSELFEDNCAYDFNCLEPGICFSIDVVAFNDDGSTDNNGFDIFFRFPPKPSFSFGNNPCQGQEIAFVNNTCPRSDPSMEFLWDYGDGSPTDDLGVHMYPDTGRYTVRLTATNFCGTQTVTRIIEVLGTPEADFAVDAGNGGGQDTVCLGETITLNGASSNFATSFRWQISPRRGFTFENDTRDFDEQPQISFGEAGTYTISLRVDNNCREANTAEQTIVVLEAPRLELQPQPDACLDLTYSPQPPVPGATYLLNGQEQSSFPVFLAASDTAYVVEARLESKCRTLVRRDTFRVSNPIPVRISSPPADTVVCVSDEPLDLRVEGIADSLGDWELNDALFELPFVPNAPGVYNIRFSTGVDECRTMDERRIEVQGVEIEVQDVSICPDTEVFPLQASPSGGRFSSLDCPACIVADSLFEPANLGGQTSVEVAYQRMDALGCAATSTFQVVLDRPQASFEIPEQVCEGEDIMPTFGASVGQQLNWFVDGQPSNSAILSGLGAGLHEILLVAGQGSCSDSSRQSIQVIAPPRPATIQSLPNEGCSPLDITLASGGNIDNTATYDWSQQIEGAAVVDTFQGFSPGAQTLMNTSDTIQNFLFILSVDNACGGSVDQREIAVKPSPRALIGLPFNDGYCSRDTLPLSNRSRGLADRFEWLDDGVSVSVDSSAPVFTYETDSLLRKTITLIAENECAADTTSEEIVIRPTDIQPGFNLESLSICAGDTLQISNRANTPEVIYRLGDGNSSNRENPLHVFQEPGTYTIQQTAFGCGSADTEQEITVHPPIEARASHPPQTCPGTELVLTNLSEGAIATLWRIDGVEVSSGNSPRIAFDSLGAYRIELEVTSLEGCSDRQESRVEVVPWPTPEFSVGDSICPGTPLDIELAGPVTGSTCEWLLDGVATTDGCNPRIFIESPGLHSLTQIVTDDIGCTGMNIQTVFVRTKPEANFEFGLDFDCSPANLIVLDRSIDASGLIWQLDGVEVSNERNPVLLLPDGGLRLLTQIASSQSLCFDTLSQEVFLAGTPRADFNLIDERCLPGDEVILEIGGSIDNSVELIHLSSDFSQSGRNRFELVESGDYRVDVLTPEGCDTSFTVSVPVFEELILSVRPDTSILLGESVILETNVNQTELTYRWWANGVEQPEFSLEPLVRPFKNTEYILEGQVGPCLYRDTTFVRVEAEKLFAVPSSFSPNGDFTNDVLQFFPGPGVEKINVLQIFDRWGELLFEQQDLPVGQIVEAYWDGTHNGRTLNPQVVVYMVEVRYVDGDVRLLTGDVALIR